MANFQNNPNDTFWLARYAYNTLKPIVESLSTEDARLDLKVHLNFGGKFEGVDVWVHHFGHGDAGVLTYDLTVSQKVIDHMASSLPNLHAAKFGVLA